MTYFFVISLLVPIGILVYLRKPNWFICYNVMLSPIYLPIFSNIFNVDRESVVILDSYIGKAALFSVLIVVIVEFLKHRNISSAKYLILSFISLYFFKIIHSIYFGGTVDFSEVDIFSYAFLVLINKNLLPDKYIIGKYILLFTIYQFVWCILEINGIYSLGVATDGYYDMSGKRIELVNGTFRRYNDMANFFTTIFLFICIDFFCYSSLTKSKMLLYSILIAVIILLSGAKISVILYLYCIIGCVFICKKKINKTNIILLGSVVLTLVFLLSSGNRDILSGFNRILEFSTEDIASNPDSTISLSFLLLSKFFFINPLFGNGLAHLGDNAYGSLFTVMQYKYDAKIAFYLVEYGIIGFLFHLIFFISIFKSISKISPKGNYIKIVYVYYTILTITENGVYDPRLMVIFLISSLSFARYKYCRERTG